MDPSPTRWTIEWGSHGNKHSHRGMPTCKLQDEIEWAPSHDDPLLWRFLGKQIQRDFINITPKSWLMKQTWTRGRIFCLTDAAFSQWELAGHRVLFQDGLWPWGGHQRAEDTEDWGQERRGRKRWRLLTAAVKLYTGWSDNEKKWRDGLHQLLNSWSVSDWLRVWWLPPPSQHDLQALPGAACFRAFKNTSWNLGPLALLVSTRYPEVRDIYASIWGQSSRDLCQKDSPSKGFPLWGPGLQLAVGNGTHAKLLSPSFFNEKNVPEILSTLTLAIGLKAQSSQSWKLESNKACSDVIDPINHLSISQE